MIPRFAALLTCALLWVHPAFSAETDVVLDLPPGQLAASYAVPEGDAPLTAVLFLAGSGPTDRNGNNAMGLNTNAYKKTADALVAAGFAVLRPDKRGVAASRGGLTKEEDILFTTYVDDAIAWAAWLRTQPRVTRVVILGHSEGALVGAVAAQSEGIAGLISLAGTGEPIGKTIRRQLKEQNAPEALQQEADRILAKLEAGETVPDASPMLASLFRLSVQPYLISWLKFDPAQEIAKVPAPVLIIQGTTDIQVRVEDAKLLSAARADAKLVLIEGMNHVLADAPADRAANSATYFKPELPLSAGLIPALVDFLKALP